MIWLQAVRADEDGEAFDFSSWATTKINCPQQDNGFDCGMFMCCFVRCLLTGDDIGKVRQEDMPSLRLLAEIMVYC